ncbi:TRAF-like family protein [Euphorbia peplus]|nr:TRAF-like family protein [Euphorbia peplus]
MVDDCCIFGAEVHVIENSVKGIEFSLIKDPPNGTFTWKIRKLSTLEKQDQHSSEVFTTGGCKWRLLLYPRGEAEQKDHSVSLYLCLDEKPHQSKVYAEYNLLLKDQVKGIHLKRKVSHWFEKAAGQSWGFRSFLVLKELRDASNGYLVNDTLVIEANMTVISVSEDLIS